jgi:hypothetical protein
MRSNSRQQRFIAAGPMTLNQNAQDAGRNPEQPGCRVQRQNVAFHQCAGGINNQQATLKEKRTADCRHLQQQKLPGRWHREPDGSPPHRPAAAIDRRDLRGQIANI